jgi:hypothetical protein
MGCGERWGSYELEPFLKDFELFGDSFAFGFGHDKFGGGVGKTAFFHVHTTGVFDNAFYIDGGLMFVGVFRNEQMGMCRHRVLSLISSI